MAIIKVAVAFGQSQIDGRIDINLLPNDIINPSNVVKYYAAGKWNNFDCTTGYPQFAPQQTYGYDTVLFNRLANNLGQTVYICKNSRGGTSFIPSTLNTGIWRVGSIAPVDHYWEFIRRLKSIKAFIEYNGDTMEVPFILASIGYTDSQFSDKSTFKTDFTNFINEIKNIIGNQNIPIVWAQFQAQQNALGSFIIDAQAELATEIPNVTLLTTTQTYFDGIHYDAATADALANEALPIVQPLYT